MRALESNPIVVHVHAKVSIGMTSIPSVTEAVCLRSIGRVMHLQVNIWAVSKYRTQCEPYIKRTSQRCTGCERQPAEEMSASAHASVCANQIASQCSQKIAKKEDRFPIRRLACLGIDYRRDEFENT